MDKVFSRLVKASFRNTLFEISGFASPIIKSRRYVIGNSQAITSPSKKYKNVWSLDAKEAPHAKRNYKPGKHFGNDIFGLIGEPVYAAISGYLHCAYQDLYQSRVSKQGKPSNGGLVVTIATNKPTSVTKEKNRKFPGGFRLIKVYPEARFLPF